MHNTSKRMIETVGKEKSMIERAMDSGKLNLKSNDVNDMAFDLTDLIDSNADEQIELAQMEPKSVQRKETERITMAIQAVEIKLLQDRVAELKAHLARSEIRCCQLAKEKKQLFDILSENKLKAESPVKRTWSFFWK